MQFQFLQTAHGLASEELRLGYPPPTRRVLYAVSTAKRSPLRPLRPHAVGIVARLSVPLRQVNERNYMDTLSSGIMYMWFKHVCVYVRLYNEPSLIRLHVNRIEIWNKKNAVHSWVYIWKKHVAFRKTDESLVCSDKTWNSFFKPALLHRINGFSDFVHRPDSK
jgi:hypothetical protein